MKNITINNEVYVSKKDSDLEIAKIKKAKGIKTVTGSGKEIPFEIGGKYFFRTVTYFATGEVAEIKGDFLVLKSAAWVADTGRFREAIMQGTLNEVEPVEVPMYLNVNVITDAFVWTHKLPDTQK
jgi:hypothetical protein